MVKYIKVEKDTAIIGGTVTNVRSMDDGNDLVIDIEKGQEKYQCYVTDIHEFSVYKEE